MINQPLRQSATHVLSVVWCAGVVPDAGRGDPPDDPHDRVLSRLHLSHRLLSATLGAEPRPRRYHIHTGPTPNRLTTCARARITGGSGGRVPQNLEQGDTVADCPSAPRFCHVSKFQTRECLHYNAVQHSIIWAKAYTALA